MKTDREKRLEQVLRDAARELPEPNVLHERIERLLSDEAAGGGEQCGLSHNELEESGLTQCQDCGANLSATPSQQRDALEDALYRLEQWDDDTYCDSPHARWADVGQVRRALSDPGPEKNDDDV